MRVKKMAPAALFIFAFVLAAATAWYVSGNILDSDASSELVLAHHLYETKQILATDWQYSTELQVLSTQLVFAPLFGIFDSWRMVRFVGTIILFGILILSYGYLCRKANLDRAKFLVGGALLLLPAGVTYARIGLYHCYYISHMAIGFILVGQYLSLNSGSKSAAVGFFILSFVSGLGGIRQGVITHVPLLLCVVLYILRRDRGRAIPKQHWWLVFWVVLGGIAFGEGLLINDQILSDIYMFDDTLDIRFALDQDFNDVLYDFLSMFGFRKSVRVLTLVGIQSLIGLAAGSVIYFSGARQLAASDAPTDDFPKFILRSFMPSLAFILLIFMLFVSIDLARYLIPIAAWAAPFLMSADYPKRSPEWVVHALVICALIVCGIGTDAYFFHPDTLKQTYEGLVDQKDIYLSQNLSGVRDFIKDEGYTLGYATYWRANTLTEMTDGQITMIGLSPDINLFFNNYCYCDDLTVYEWRGQEDARPILVESVDDLGLTLIFGSGELEQVYQDDYYTVYEIQMSVEDIHARLSGETIAYY